MQCAEKIIPARIQYILIVSLKEALNERMTLALLQSGPCRNPFAPILTANFFLSFFPSFFMLYKGAVCTPSPRKVEGNSEEASWAIRLRSRLDHGVVIISSGRAWFFKIKTITMVVGGGVKNLEIVRVGGEPERRPNLNCRQLVMPVRNSNV